MIGQSEMEASQESRKLSDFKYACVGYSLYVDRKKEGSTREVTPTELPVCVGLEVVAGRYVNAFSTNDWMLGIAFRASLLSKGLAGIQPVDVPGIENVDVSDIIEGHCSYLWSTQHILEQLELDTYYPVFNRDATKQEID